MSPDLTFSLLVGAALGMMLGAAGGPLGMVFGALLCAIVFAVLLPYAHQEDQLEP